MVETSLDWTPQNATINLKYTLFAHRVLANLGVVRLDVSGLSNDSIVSVTDVLDVSLIQSLACSVAIPDIQPL